MTNGDGCSLLAASGDQVLVNGIGNELLETTGAMQVDSSKKMTYFDFNSFYFGCDLLTKDAVNVAGLVPGLPVACVVTIKGMAFATHLNQGRTFADDRSLIMTGYYQSRLIGQQQFAYSPADGVKTAKLVAGKCHSGFQGVDRVSDLI